MSELDEKLARVGALLKRRGVDALHLTRSGNVAWLTGGARAYVDVSAEQGVASLLLTPRGRHLITNNIEAPRLVAEEPFAGFQVVAPPWHEESDGLSALTSGLSLGADAPLPGAVNLSGDLVALRAPLLPEEIERYRALGRDVGAAMREVAEAATPGMTEHQVAGLVARAVFAVGAFPVVVLVASDERLEAHRHPLPTDKRIERTLMWVVCARRQGLIANLTRLVSFGPLSDEQRRKMAAVAEIEATAHATTRPGVPVRDVLARMQAAYARTGFADEWRNHHQGGACSYAARDFVVDPRSEQVVQAPQAFAWNPSVPGAKSEDTVLCTDAGLEVLTDTPGWPMQEVRVEGRLMTRPAVLER